MITIYRTKRVEWAATIMTVTGFKPIVSRDLLGKAIFSFPLLPEVIDVVDRFDTGIQVDAKKLLINHNQLFKRVHGGRYGRFV